MSAALDILSLCSKQFSTGLYILLGFSGYIPLFFCVWQITPSAVWPIPPSPIRKTAGMVLSRLKSAFGHLVPRKKSTRIIILLSIDTAFFLLELSVGMLTSFFTGRVWEGWTNKSKVTRFIHWHLLRIPFTWYGVYHRLS